MRRGLVSGDRTASALLAVGLVGERSSKQDDFIIALGLNVQFDAGVATMQGGGGEVAGAVVRDRNELGVAGLPAVLLVLESGKLNAERAFAVRQSVEGLLRFSIPAENPHLDVCKRLLLVADFAVHFANHHRLQCRIVRWGW